MKPALRVCLPGLLALVLVLGVPLPALADNPDIVNAAQAQVGVTRRYDPGYQVLKYPGGDVPLERGVCTDVVVRALRAAAAYLPGDIVAWDLGRGILHIGIVSDLRSVTGTPLVVHNIGAGAREEDILFRYTIIGQYRLPGKTIP